MTLTEAHILLVDDEAILRMTLGLVLRRHGATVTEVANGADALDVLRHGAVDLVLTDWHMPGMDGPALLRAAAEQGFHVPAVLCTGTLGDRSDAIPAGLGVAATLLKPFPPMELIETLQGVLEPLPSRG